MTAISQKLEADTKTKKEKYSHDLLLVFFGTLAVSTPK
jgi:hypothetical protein